MDLPTRRKLALAEFLLESVEFVSGSEAKMAWNVEICDRIEAINKGQVAGVSYEEVMRMADAALQTRPNK